MKIVGTVLGANSFIQTMSLNNQHTKIYSTKITISLMNTQQERWIVQTNHSTKYATIHSFWIVLHTHTAKFISFYSSLITVARCVFSHTRNNLFVVRFLECANCRMTLCLLSGDYSKLSASRRIALALTLLEIWMDTLFADRCPNRFSNF